MARNPSFAITSLEEDFKALGIGVPRKRALVETGVPPWMPTEDDEPVASAEDDDAEPPHDEDDAPSLPGPVGDPAKAKGERKGRKEAVMPPEDGPKHPAPAGETDDADADDEPHDENDVQAPGTVGDPKGQGAAESKKGRLERIKKALSQSMSQEQEPPHPGDMADDDEDPAHPDDVHPEAANDPEIDAGQTPIEGDDEMPPHDEDDAPMPPPPPAKKKTEAGVKTHAGTSKQRKQWRDYAKKHKAQRHQYAKSHAKKAQQHRAKVSKMRHGAAAKGKRIYTGMERISNLIENVEALVGTFREQRLTETVRSFANLSLISDLLSRGFRTLSTKLEDKELVPVARNFAEMSDDAAAIANDLDAMKKGEADPEEPHLDDDEVEEAFRQMMAMMLDGVDLYDNMAPAEWQSVDGPEHGEDDEEPPHAEDDELSGPAHPTVGEPGYEPPAKKAEGKGRKENAPPPASPMPGKLGAEDDEEPHDEDDVPMPTAKKPGMGAAEAKGKARKEGMHGMHASDDADADDMPEMDPGAVGAASTKPGKDREEDDDADADDMPEMDPGAVGAASTKPGKDREEDDEEPPMPEAARHTRIKEMKALLGKGAARKTA